MADYYGMYSTEGNALIKGVIMTAISQDLDWDKVCDVLIEVSNLKGFGEAYDTVVRECVYTEIFEDREDNDGQPDEAQEWHDYDPDC